MNKSILNSYDVKLKNMMLMFKYHPNTDEVGQLFSTIS